MIISIVWVELLGSQSIPPFICSAGRTGTAVSFLTKTSIPKLHAIEDLTGKKLKMLEGIEEKDVLLIMSKVGKSMRVANEFLLKNGFEEKEAKRKARKRDSSPLVWIVC